MAPLRPDTLAVALSRAFEDAQDSRASWFALTRGERLFSAGDRADTLYLLRAGRLGVFRHDDGRVPQMTAVIKPGEPVGELAMLAGTSHMSDVVALRDSDVLARFGGDEFVAFALDDAHPSAILARLQDNLRAFNLMQERTYLLAVSAGAVKCDPGSGTALLDYVQLADREMYLHKRSCLH